MSICALCALVMTRAAAVGVELPPQDVTAIAEAVQEASDTWDVPPGLVLAVIENESRYRSNSIGCNHDFGLMQVRPPTAREVVARMGVHPRPYRYLKRIHYNVFVGTAYLRLLKNKFRSWRRALTAYNRGPSAFLRDRKHNHYAGRVLRRWRRIRRLVK